MEGTKIYSKQKISSSNITREDFDSGPVSLDEIEDGLFLGNLSAACSLETLKNYQITSILTLDTVPLPCHISEQSFLTTKYVHVSDMPREDLLHYLEECINYITDSLKNGKVLVHCYFGVSRSSAIVIAYIMKKYNLDYGPAYEMVLKKRKYVQPNVGFIFQLKLFKRMGCKIDPNYQKYKKYRLRIASEKVKKAKILPQSCMDLIQPDPGLTQENPEPIVYRCRQCRRILANKSHVLNHNSKIIENNTKINTELDSESKSDNNIQNLCEQLQESSIVPENEEQPIIADVCDKIVFLEPIAWMKDILKHSQGRLNCPKCNQKLGSFSWVNGCCCPCGSAVAPAFYLVPSKVELSKIVQNVQLTL
ncbi:dual specificity protein phosphatase MPK-4 [Condylostylus longicornis]|uniref:dual specificity protein phosphatase MPK-4 n=1 Tax=Condylostylus longicornis TaxID=2530218 RepID=UPI00244DAC68|nr:dual specificity protein phosphatase MPK-4 [Condylostylus longicornis]